MQSPLHTASMTSGGWGRSGRQRGRRSGIWSRGDVMEKDLKVRKRRKQNMNLSLLEDINVEVGSMRVHLTLFDQKLLS